MWRTMPVQHIKAMSKKTMPALAGGKPSDCLQYLLDTGDFSGFKECKASNKDQA